MNNPLFKELIIVQNDYLSLLKKLDKFPQDEISLAMIDSINVFWYENRNIVNLVFEYLFRGRDTYCFSAATIFDIDYKEQNSFFLLGDYHVFDDPLPSYLNTLIGVTDEVYLKKMKRIISDTIKDNIRIIDEIKSDLIILPLRYTSVILNQHYNDLDQLAENIFCNFFTNITNIKEYKYKVVTTGDLIEHLDHHNSASILLFDGDDPTETWEYRMHKYREENDYFEMDSLSIGEMFFLAVFGNVRQALALIDIARNFEVIPFIRSFIPLHYYILLSSVLEHNSNPELRCNQVNYSLWKTKVSYFLYQEFRKRRINFSLGELNQKANYTGFESKVFADLEGSDDKQEISTIRFVVNKYLDEILKS
ncbi:hypothetical protein P9654_12140 [Bacillus atrophaeus]|uniref:hypothetical protein n=1 Tax=Bacillus atrophaeus TaxID=1452 RepID=UPI002E1E997D|nr:hypothetical protein [Bacillus atrophaeus]MED4820590.1 hypothetical protein [Bacillus atrophaeus]